MDSPGELVAIVDPEVVRLSQGILHGLGVPDLLDENSLRGVRTATPGDLYNSWYLVTPTKMLEYLHRTDEPHGSGTG